MGTSARHTWHGSRRGFTIVEVVFASLISSLVVAGTAALFVAMARSDRVVFGQTRMRVESVRVLSAIEVLLRSGQRTDGVIVMDRTDPTDLDSQRIRVRRLDASGDEVLSEVRFSAASGPEQNQLIIDRDVLSSAEPLEILSAKPPADSLRPFVSDVLFAIPTDANAGDVPLSNCITVTLTLSDQGATTRSWKDDDEKTLTVVRNIVLRAP